MRNAKVVGMAAAALLALVVAQAQAQITGVPVKAKTYSVNFARAFDACTGSFVTVVSPGSVGACTPANSITDSTVAAINTASLKIGVNAKNGPKLGLKAKGIAPTTTKIGLRLTLRTSNAQGSPTGSKTYQDETVICGDMAGGTCGRFFVVEANGKVSGKETLKDCLDKNNLPETLASGNIELLDAALLNCDTGKVIAVPGLLQTP